MKDSDRGAAAARGASGAGAESVGAGEWLGGMAAGRVGMLAEKLLSSMGAWGAWGSWRRTGTHRAALAREARRWGRRRAARRERLR